MSNSINLLCNGTSKKTEFDNSGMGYLSLLLLGALDATAQDSCKGNDFKKIYATDKEGLVISADQAGQILEQLHSSINAVSNLAANTNPEEVPESMQDVFYLIHGLAQLAERVTAIKSDLDFAIQKA